MVLLFFATGCQQVEQFGSFTKRAVSFGTGKTPVNAVKKMEDRYFADERRIGINMLVDNNFGRRPPYTERYQQIAQHDNDWLVRATAIRALNRSRDASATSIFIKGLSDQNEIVRVESAKALANVPDEAAVPTLLRIVGNAEENRDVRIWSAHALRHYATLDVARVLVNQLGSRDFGVAWQSHKTLKNITGQDLAYDDAAWLEYLTGPDKPFG